MSSNRYFAAAAVLGTGLAMTAAGAQTPPNASAPPSTGSRVFVNRTASSYLGVGCADIDGERAKALHLKEERGVEVKSVNGDSPAARAGLKEGDVVLDFNGQPVEGTTQLQRMVRETPPGRQVKLTVFRGGSTQTVSATIGSASHAWGRGDEGSFSFTMPEIHIPDIPPMPDVPRVEMSWRSGVLGVVVESLSSQLAEFFGVKEGALVKSVTKSSAADKAGIRAGDVIIKVDGSNVSSSREITSALRALRTRKTFPVVVVRSKKEMTLSVTVEERHSHTGKVRARAELRWPEAFAPGLHELRITVDPDEF
jgi:serine protease Do